MKKKTSLEDFVYNELTQAIFNRKIPLTAQLNEEMLSEAFNVSRTPIRSVLKRLQYEKIIQISPHKGAYIYQPTPKEIKDVLHLRSILEKEGIVIACEIATQEQLDELEEITYREETLFKNGEYANGLLVGSEFHQKLLQISKNELMVQYNQELINITNIYLVFHENVVKENPRSPEEHRAIIQALRDRNKDLALHLFDQHFISIKENLKNEHFEKNIDFTKIFTPYTKVKK